MINRAELYFKSELLIGESHWNKEHRVLNLLLSYAWVPNYEFIKLEVGAVSGLRSLRKIREKGGLDIQKRKPPRSNSWEYKLFTPPHEIDFNKRCLNPESIVSSVDVGEQVEIF